jgi:hypothetical protein
MWFSSALGRPTATSKPTPRGRPALVRPRKFVPVLEALEGRDTPSTTVLTVSPNPATAGQAVTLTATVTSSGGELLQRGMGLPPGSVTFFDGSASLRTVQVVRNFGNGRRGDAQFSASGLGVGTHSLSARYSGESGQDALGGFSENAPSTSNPVSEVINAPSDPGHGVINAPNVSVARVPVPGMRNAAVQLVQLRNTSGVAVKGPIFLVLHGLKRKVRLKGASGLAQQHGQPGDPLVQLNVTLLPGAELTLGLQFSNPTHQPMRFTAEVLVGEGAV